MKTCEDSTPSQVYNVRMSRVLILGYGNPLRGDDGFGPALAQRLQGALHGNDAIEIIASHQLALEYAEPLSRAERVVFMDARDGDTPGEIFFEKLPNAADVPAQGAPARFTHHLSPQTLLAYTQSLYGARPSEAFLLSVCGKNFGYSETLTTAVADALERAYQQLLGFCKTS